MPALVLGLGWESGIRLLVRAQGCGEGWVMLAVTRGR